MWRYGSEGEPRRLDCYWDAEGVVVEIDGIGHLGLAQRIDDDHRQNGFVAREGLTFLRVTNFELRYEPELFIADPQVALELRAA